MRPMSSRRFCCLELATSLKCSNVREDLRRVDHTDHTTLAMLALCAVEPNRRGGILDFVGKCPVCHSLSGDSGYVARPETVGHGRTGLSKGALSDGVVFGPETESNGITLGCGDTLGHEDEGTGLVGDGDKVLFRSSGADKGGGSDN
jgi:hypothetical protein